MLKSLLMATLASTVLAFSAHAGEMQPYSQERLEALQSEGHPVLVEVFAEWCSTCQRQSPIIARLLAEDAFADYAALKLDWDDQRDEARALGAPRQSTLFVYRDGEQIGMSVAETNEERLRAFLETGLN
jgi:thioredoxin 1